MKTACIECGKYGHWAVGHVNDGQVCSNLLSNYAPLALTVVPLHHNREGGKQSSLLTRPLVSLIQFTIPLECKIYFVVSHPLSAFSFIRGTLIVPTIDACALYAAIEAAVSAFFFHSTTQATYNFFLLMSQFLILIWYRYGAGYYCCICCKFFASLMLQYRADDIVVIESSVLFFEGLPK